MAGSAGGVKRGGGFEFATRRAVESESHGALYGLRHHAQLATAGQTALQRQGAPATPAEASPATAEGTADTGYGNRNADDRVARRRTETRRRRRRASVVGRRWCYV